MNRISNNKRIHKRFGIIAIMLIVCMAVGVVWQNYNKNAVLNLYSFSETDISSLSSVEEDNINSILDSLYIENDKYCGFSSNSNMSVDLYVANAIVSMAQLLPDFDIEILREKLVFLSSVNIEDFDFLNLSYYINLCSALDLDIDYSDVNNKLIQYYDKDMNLFYVDNENDTINVKLVATAMIKKAMKNNLSRELFSPEEGIEQAYNAYNFLMEDDFTLYNSGGDILYCISVFNMNNIVDKSRLMDWFEYWENIYSKTDMSSSIIALQYSEYINIAKIFEPEYSIKKIKDYYNSLSEANIGEIDDLYVLYNTLNNSDKLNNTLVNELIKKKISDVVNSDSFVNLNLDVKSTAYGVMLAQETGYTLNEEKLKNYIKQVYARDTSLDTTYDRTYYLYYNLILDQLINGYDQDYNSTYFQTQIDELLNTIDYSSQSMAGDIISTRRLVEIISDLQIFDVDIELTNSQKNKIKKGLKKAIKEDIIKNSVLFTDIFIVNKILSLDIVSDKDLIDVYNELTVDGGTKSSAENEIIPDITSTFQFYSSLDMMNNYEYLQNQKKFVETLENEDSIYISDANSDELDLSVIVYGNAIYSFEPGGDKNDTVK